MIRLIAIAGFAVAAATAAQAVTPAPIARPNGVIIQVREGCGVGMVMVNGVCVARSTIRQQRREYYGTTGYGGSYGTGDYYSNRGYYGNGAAQGRVTYEQAWAKCKAQLDWMYRAGESQRYTRGAACMYGYGYRL